jgi:hypothetical protein
MILCASTSLAAILALSAPESDPLGPPTEANPPLFPDADSPPAENPPVPAPESSEPEKPEPEISNLLTSDEPEAEDRRVVAPVEPSERVDRAERLRGYYASTYRPANNPARVWFAARGAYSLTGSNASVGGGRMVFASVEAGQTWNWLGYGLGATLLGGSLTFGEDGITKSSGLLIGGGPSLGLGRLSLLGRGYVDLRAGYNFFYAPVQTNLAGLADPADASPHGPKIQLDLGLLLHDSESRRFRHGLGVTMGWQMLVHSFSGEYPRLNSFNVGIGYFFG